MDHIRGTDTHQCKESNELGARQLDQVSRHLLQSNVANTTKHHPPTLLLRGNLMMSQHVGRARVLHPTLRVRRDETRRDGTMRNLSGSPTSVYPWIHNKTKGLNDATTYPVEQRQCLPINCS